MSRDADVGGRKGCHNVLGCRLENGILLQGGLHTAKLQNPLWQGKRKWLFCKRGEGSRSVVLASSYVGMLQIFDSFLYGWDVTTARDPQG